MPQIYKTSEMEFKEIRSPVSHFSWKASTRLGKLSGSKYLHFDLKSLLPGKFSYPYHFHRNAEELFLILEGEATLRTPEGYTRITQGDLIFFAEGPSGTHQLYNHGDKPCVYLDLCTKANVDVCEYPDSGKINILPAMDIFEEETRVSYYKGEEGVREKWPEDLLKQDD